MLIIKRAAMQLAGLGVLGVCAELPMLCFAAAAILLLLLQSSNMWIREGKVYIYHLSIRATGGYMRMQCGICFVFSQCKCHMKRNSNHTTVACSHVRHAASNHCMLALL